MPTFYFQLNIEHRTVLYGATVSKKNLLIMKSKVVIKRIGKYANYFIGHYDDEDEGDGNGDNGTHRGRIKKQSCETITFEFFSTISTNRLMIIKHNN